ncbi:MAG TPA: PhzF family phenazine biosynthesis isomerase, partial [Candidatus Elarobacter sp.]
GGNPAGVVVDARGLSARERQRVAAAVGAPETAFVEREPDGAFAVAFYTPTKQVPDCGHATVATFAVLSARGELRGSSAVKRTIIGDRAIAVEDGRVFMDQPRPAVLPLHRPDRLVTALAIPPDAILGTPVVADHGVRFVLIETTTVALAGAMPRLSDLEAISAEVDAIGFYVFARTRGVYDATIRMFAPRYGIPEEPATGMAAGLLAGTLALDRDHAAFTFLQGALSPIPSPSEIVARVEPGRVVVGGAAATLHTLDL